MSYQTGSSRGIRLNTIGTYLSFMRPGDYVTYEFGLGEYRFRATGVIIEVTSPTTAKVQIEKIYVRPTDEKSVARLWKEGDIVDAHADNLYR